jgi:hypothetical protein
MMIETPAAADLADLPASGLLGGEVVAPRHRNC